MRNAERALTLTRAQFPSRCSFLVAPAITSFGRAQPLRNSTQDAQADPLREMG